MIAGIGNDIIEIKRIKRSIGRYGRRFLDKLFTPKEQQYCNQYAQSERNYAGRFAAKEAIAKALGCGFGKELSFLDIEILNDETGKPLVTIKGRDESVMLTISHCKEYATAVALIRD